MAIIQCPYQERKSGPRNIFYKNRFNFRKPKYSLCLTSGHVVCVSSWISVLALTPSKQNLNGPSSGCPWQPLTHSTARSPSFLPQAFQEVFCTPSSESFVTRKQHRGQETNSGGHSVPSHSLLVTILKRLQAFSREHSIMFISANSPRKIAGEGKALEGRHEGGTEPLAWSWVPPSPGLYLCDLGPREIVGKAQRQKEGDRDLPFESLFSKCKAKAKRLNLNPGLPYGCQVSKHLGHHTLPPGGSPLAGSWIRSGGTGTQSGTLGGTWMFWWPNAISHFFSLRTNCPTLPGLFWQTSRKYFQAAL